MAQETRTSRSKITAELSPSLRDRFKSRCRKLNVSQAQRLRDLIQQDVKPVKKAV